MTILNTDMHIVTFLITVFEAAMLFFAFIWFLSRPSEKSRGRYVVLLLLLIVYNLFSGLFPDARIKIPIPIQNILAYMGGICVSMYFVYYIYKSLELENLKRLAVYGSLWFLFLPFIVLFVVPYMLTDNLELSRKLIVVVPFLFSVYYIITLTRAIRSRFKMLNSRTEKEETIGLYISVLLWAALPVIVYFDGSQLLEHSITNAGFMIMSVVYVRSAIFKSRKDHQQLQDSKKELELTNQGLQQKVVERTLELQLANEKRLNSFINLMHETKTPLTLINNCLEDLMIKYGDNEEVEITKLSLSKLNRNMSNFFDIHKLERGIHIYDHSKYVDFGQLVEQSITIFKKLAEQMDIQIYSRQVSKTFVQADPEALYRIVDNLLENAIKYSGKGSKVEIKLTEIDNLICFSIKDNGPGIHHSNHEKIFDPFYQVDHKKKNVQGIGMGLSLVKRTVESIGGFIELQSEVNQGTEFKVFIPRVDQLNEKDLEISEKYKVDTLLPPKKYPIKDLIYEGDRYSLLIIEDQKELLYRLSQQLSKLYNIYVSQNGNEAKQKLDSISAVPDLIICDVMMDEMDGFEFVESIRKNKRYQHIPIIFVTAISEEAEKLKGLKLGAVDFVVKPFKTDELKLKIESIFRLHEQQKIALIEQASKSIRKNQNKNTEIFGNSFIEKCKKYHLTDREIEILQCRMKKLSYKEIASKLFISEKTVSNHLSKIAEKIGTIDRSELIERLG